MVYVEIKEALGFFLTLYKRDAKEKEKRGRVTTERKNKERRRRRNGFCT
jgi:hypothetical protein